jgi:hypothetical protein
MKRCPLLPDTSSSLPPDLGALWGAFLFEGLMTSDQQRNRSQAVLESWNQGCVELVWQCCSFLPEVWRQIEPHWNHSPVGLPGVFEYEVVSEFGTLLGDHLILNDGQLPDMETVRKMIRVLVADFMNPPADRFKTVRSDKQEGADGKT